jgi:tetratricopeptide (TPR) repeat protein
MGGFRDGYEWYHAALEYGVAIPVEVRVELLGFAGHAANGIGRVEESKDLCRASIDLAREAGLPPMPIALQFLGITALESNRPEEAISYCDEAVAVAREHGDQWAEVNALQQLAMVCSLGGEPERGRMLADEALTAARRLGNAHLVVQALFSAGQARVDTEPDVAVELLDELTTAGRIRRVHNLGQAAFFRGIAQLRLKQLPQAARSLQVALVLFQESGGEFFISTVVGTAAALFTRAAPAAAAQLLAALDRFATETGIPGAPADVATRQRARARVEQTLGPDAFADAWSQGAAMTIDEAAALAHDELGKLAT